MCCLEQFCNDDIYPLYPTIEWLASWFSRLSRLDLHFKDSKIENRLDWRYANRYGYTAPVGMFTIRIVLVGGRSPCGVLYIYIQYCTCVLYIYAVQYPHLTFSDTSLTDQG